MNNDVDLSKQAEIFYKEWNHAKRIGQQFDRHSFFTLFNYPWTLNAYRKAELFRIISSQVRHEQINHAIIQNLNSFLSGADHNQTINSILGASHLTLKIRRDHLLEDSLNNLVMKGVDPQMIRKPLRVIFEGEPGIDEGGVKKEFFILLFKELFNPEYGMFMYNPDNRLYYFDGRSYESPYNFELIGMLMGLAPTNQCLLDIPIASVCYKVLLDVQPDLEDLRQWKPDVAASFDYILNYEEEQPLEEILARTFTIDFEHFGERVTETLKEGGDKILVTKENRKEFVALYIDHLFYAQCEK